MALFQMWNDLQRQSFPATLTQKILLTITADDLQKCKHAGFLGEDLHPPVLVLDKNWLRQFKTFDFLVSDCDKFSSKLRHPVNF